MSEESERYAVIISYDGTNYNGWQSQVNGIAIQDILNDSVKRITGEETKIIGAGRTDAGVHAMGQVASFTLEEKWETEKLKFKLNAVLPNDIFIRSLFCAPASFHPIADSLRKQYKYFFSTARNKNPFIDRFVWRISYELNVEKMKEASAKLVGLHDFSAFRNTGSDAKTSEREIIAIDWDRTDNIDVITFTANGFLKQMVRIMVGTLADVGRGKFGLEHIPFLLQSGDRNAAGTTAPSKGLFLWNIEYPGFKSEIHQLFF